MHLTQENYRGDPWGVLVTCCFLNKTAGRVANPIIKEFLKRWPTPGCYIAMSKSEEVRNLIFHLGLYRVRIKRLLNIAYGLVRGVPYDKIEGVGKYGRDSYQIFVEKEIDLNPTDAKLKAYLVEKRRERRFDGKRQAYRSCKTLFRLPDSIQIR